MYILSKPSIMKFDVDKNILPATDRSWRLRSRSQGCGCGDQGGGRPGGADHDDAGSGYDDAGGDDCVDSFRQWWQSSL